MLASTAQGEEAGEPGYFGKLAVHRDSSQPSHVALLVPGGGGWKMHGGTAAAPPPSAQTPPARTGDTLPEAAPASEVSNLPVIEVPATAGESEMLAFIASGDGGWSGLDAGVAKALAAQGIPVVGLNSLRYFWKPRTPDESAQALDAILRQCLQAWNKQRLLLIGYSQGADVLPFMVSRLPADLSERIDAIVLLGLAPEVTFEFHVSGWFGTTPKTNVYQVMPEVEKLRGRNLLCLYGADEKHSLCPELRAGLVKLDMLPGGHHFGGDYAAVARRILAVVPKPDWP